MKRIKYVSRFARPLTAGEITHLAEAAARKNSALGITGILLTSGGLFFQILEGPAEHVDALFRDILIDERHTQVYLLSAEDGVKSRLFPDWSMKKIDMDQDDSARLEPLKAVLETLHAQRQILETLSRTLERAVWTEMSARD